MEFEIVHIRSLFENATEGMIVTDSKGIFFSSTLRQSHVWLRAKRTEGSKIEIIVPAKYAKNHVKLRDGFYHDPKTGSWGITAIAGQKRRK
jgi:hypothetical protein